MGLLLERDPSSSLADLTSLRHLPPRRASTKPTKLKISRGRFDSWTSRLATAQADDAPSPARRPLRPHQAAALAGARRRPQGGLHTAHRAGRRLVAETREGREVARSALRLPSDPRPPSLERQEAFSEPATAKKRLRDVEAADNEVDVDVAELYRLGLLYDDEHERGAGFSLGTIVHTEPVYTLNVRPGKRGRKAGKLVEETHLTGLPLNLSFAAFGDDDALAHYLMAPSVGELSATDGPSQHAGAARMQTRTSPITVIYELDGSTHSFDLPAEAPLPREADFPDLVSDNDDDDCDDHDDWAILMAASHTDDETEGEEDEDAPGDGGGNAASGGPDAWIVLG